MSTASPTAMTEDLSRKAKVFVAACALAGTGLTATINGWVNVHFGAVQADEAERKADVRKAEDQVGEFDQLVRAYMVGLNHDEPSAAQREAVMANAQSQYDFLGRLKPLLDAAGSLEVEAYRQRLVEVSKNLRASHDIPSTQPFAQSVAHAIDERIKAMSALRRGAGMPVATPDPAAALPAKDFAAE